MPNANGFYNSSNVSRGKFLRSNQIVVCISIPFFLYGTQIRSLRTCVSAGSEKFYESNRVPFGYSSSGMCFQRSFKAVLKDIIYTYCLVYIDNVLVKSPDF